MVKNVLHHAFMVTYSVSRDVHPDEYLEIKAYLQQFGKWYMLKAEDVFHEGKVHLHFIIIFEHEEYNPNPESKYAPATKYGARRAGNLEKHIARHCPLIRDTIVTHGSRHSLKADPLTSGQYITYLSKETDCHADNMPEEMTLIMPYLTEKTVRQADPEMCADQDAYITCSEDKELRWAVNPPTVKSCVYFYRYMMFHQQVKKTIKRDDMIKQKAKTLWRFMTKSVYSDDEDHFVVEAEGNRYDMRDKVQRIGRKRKQRQARSTEGSASSD